ncbi:MAG TPA: hypothetical protein VG425_15865 [Casimicrobiaceae bacterium]|jgi:hypothetical protein|nr:hypothetical protein [Casimicrobiaceae bacterium]
MNDQHAERIIRLLEEIRDGQRLQLERQSQALERQAEVLAQQRERLAGLSKGESEAQGIGERAGRILAESSKLVRSARILVLMSLPFALLLLAFVLWALFAQVAR